MLSWNQFFRNIYSAFYLVKLLMLKPHQIDGNGRGLPRLNENTT